MASSIHLKRYNSRPNDHLPAEPDPHEHDHEIFATSPPFQAPNWCALCFFIWRAYPHPGLRIDAHDPNSALAAPTDPAFNRHSPAITDVKERHRPYTDYPSQPDHITDAYELQYPLVGNTAGFNGVKDFADPEYMTIDAAEVSPKDNQSALARFLNGDGGRYPLEQRIDQKRRGLGRQKHPFVGALCNACMVVMFLLTCFMS
jgi:hypothetical protein